MCECTEQLNQVMDSIKALDEHMGRIDARLEQVDIRSTATDDNVAEIHAFATEMNQVMVQFKAMFSEENLMGMLGGLMGGGMPEIRG